MDQILVSAKHDCQVRNKRSPGSQNEVGQHTRALTRKCCTDMLVCTARDEGERTREMAKRTQKRRTTPTRGTKSSDSTNFIAQARRELDEALKVIAHPSRNMADLAKLVRSLLENMEKYYRGEISNKEFLQAQASIPNRFKPIAPPRWLPPEVAWLLTQYLDRLESGRKGAAKEVVRWLEKRLAAPRGRPLSSQTYSIGQEAATLHDDGLSWMRIARKICPDRGAGHTCSKNCADKIRQAAEAFAAR